MRCAIRLETGNLLKKAIKRLKRLWLASEVRENFIYGVGHDVPILVLFIHFLSSTSTFSLLFLIWTILITFFHFPYLSIRFSLLSFSPRSAFLFDWLVEARFRLLELDVVHLVLLLHLCKMLFVWNIWIIIYRDLKRVTEWLMGPIHLIPIVEIGIILR